MDYFASAFVFGYDIVEDLAYLLEIDMVTVQDSLGSLRVTENGRRAGGLARVRASWKAPQAWLHARGVPAHGADGPPPILPASAR